MQKNTFYRNEFVYQGWKIMMIKPGPSSLVMVNYWPAFDLAKVEEIQFQDKILCDKIKIILSKSMGSFRLSAAGRNPNFDYVVIEAKSYIDRNFGSFDLNRKLQQILSM